MAMDLPTPFPAPPTTKVSAPPTPSVDPKATTQLIRDVLFRRTKPCFTDLHPRIATTPRMVTPPPRVANPPPRVVLINVQANEPVSHRTCNRIYAIYASSRAFLSDFIDKWAASRVLHGNQWETLALSVINTENGHTLEYHALRRHPRMGASWNTS